MRRRTRRLSRISKYFGQRKRMCVADLQKAGRERIKKAKKLDELISRRNAHIMGKAAALCSKLSVGDLAYFESGREYFERKVNESGLALEKAEGNERVKREALVRAAVTHRIWEGLVTKNLEGLQKHESKKKDRVLDDLALIHSHSKDIEE